MSIGQVRKLTGQSVDRPSDDWRTLQRHLCLPASYANSAANH